jgi:hypothetical protein
MTLSRAARLILVVLCMAAASLAAATSVRQQTLEQLSAEAHVIVRGRVAEITTRQASGRQPVTTIIKIAVENQFKGAKISSLEIEQAGGAQGDVSLGLAGSPEFYLGEDLIVLLKRQRSGGFVIVGGKQGKFTVKTEPKTNNQVVEDFAHRSESLESFLAHLASVTGRN